MKNKVWIVLVAAIVMTSCGGEQDEVNHVEPTVTPAVQEPSRGLQLNNGEKWKINAEMTPFIKDSEQLLRAYGKDGNNDFTQLGLSLKENNNNLIASCNMNGPAHDELHKWLMPQLELVSALQKAGTEEEALPVIEALKSSFNDFNTYFE